MGNITSVQKAPVYAHKRDYYQCDNMLESEKPTIILPNKTHGKSDDKDDVDLYEESWVDIEPYSGVCLRASQKLMVSALFESDELFENSNRFIPIYYLFRSGNFTQEGVSLIFNNIIFITFRLM